MVVWARRSRDLSRKIINTEGEARARFDRMLRLGTSPAPVGRPELGTADEYLAYLARPLDPAWIGQGVGKPAPLVTGEGEEVLFADIVAGGERGRSSEAQITYSERGNIQGVQFYAVAAAAYEEARRHGIGREIPTEWFLQDIRD